MAVVAVWAGIVSKKFPETGKPTGKITSYRARISVLPYITYFFYYTFTMYFSFQADLAGDYQGKRYLYSLLYAAHLAGLQMSSGQLMVVQNTGYFNAVFDFAVVDDVTQNGVLSVSWPNIITALPKPGVGGQEFKRGRQFINILFSLSVTPLGKRIQPHGFHIVACFG